MKKIRLKATQSDQKIFREVTALARLYHRYIVRYYTTWVETSENESNVTSTVGSSAGTSVPRNGSFDRSTTDEDESDPFAVNLNDLNSGPVKEDRHSFPSIHFKQSESPESSESEPSGSLFSDEDALFDAQARFEERLVKKAATPNLPSVTRTLYIQMVGLTQILPNL